MENPPLVPAIMQTLRNKPFMGLEMINIIDIVDILSLYFDQLIGLLPAWVCDMTAFTMLGKFQF